MLPLNVTLSYYKRRDIQEEIIKSAANREVAVRYEDKFGSRPDVLNNPNDILELAKQKATSFHASEELWSSPLQLNPNMRKQEMDELRIGWDLVLDIDCYVWELSKIITWLIIKSLREHGIKSVSLKFSGNKGFHVGVPFEAFPIKIDKSDTKCLFPSAPQKIAQYLLNYISNKHIDVDGEKIILGNEFKIPLQAISLATKKSVDDLTKKYCSRCHNPIKKEKKAEDILCRYCGSILVVAENCMKCPRCGKAEELKNEICKCGSKECFIRFNALSIIEVDTILISSRHLFRMPYSLHEKSGLVSLPLNPDDVLKFRKEDANPENAKVSKFRFLDKDAVAKGEARELVMQAFDFTLNKEIEINAEVKKDYEITAALPEQVFPPCITLIGNGLSDGRKRALFILINFLTSLGWGYKEVEDYLKAWNRKNTEPLRENYLVGQLKYHKTQKKKILPPNCNNDMYYVNIGVCKPDNLCSKIKNPVSYSIRKSLFSNKAAKKKDEAQK